MAKLTNDSNNQTYIYHQLTIYNSHDSEDDFRSGCRNVKKKKKVIVNNNSSFQNYTNPDDHTQQTTDTPGFKPFTVLHLSLDICHVDLRTSRVFLPYLGTVSMC